MTHRSEVPVASRVARKDFDGSEFMFFVFSFWAVCSLGLAFSFDCRVETTASQFHKFTGFIFHVASWRLEQLKTNDLVFSNAE